MTIRLLAAFAAMSGVWLAASGTAAQQTPQPPPQPNSQMPPPVDRPGAFERQSQFEAGVWQNSLTQQATVITSPARLSRAERLAAMINEGKCAEAYQVALDEGDRRVARRINQICSLDR